MTEHGVSTTTTRTTTSTTSTSSVHASATHTTTASNQPSGVPTSVPSSSEIRPAHQSSTQGTPHRERETVEIHVPSADLFGGDPNAPLDLSMGESSGRSNL